MKKVIIVSSLILFLSACGDSEPPVKIETFDKVNSLFGAKYVEVKVTGIADEVVVEDIIVNRGNCKRETLFAKLPKTLKFGQSVSPTFSAPCVASEVSVITSSGDWTVEY